MPPRPRPRHANYFPADSVEFVEFAPTAPPFIGTSPARGRRWQGIKYERLVQAWLVQTFGPEYIASPWLRFRLRDKAQLQWCQPDGLLIDTRAGQITIVEVKYQHCPDAWYQMNMLYAPVLAQLFPAPDWRLATCEVVKWFDCAISTPQPPKLRDSVAKTRPGEFAVFILKEQLKHGSTRLFPG